MMIIIIIVIIEPIEDKLFQVVKKSEYETYRRGIPLIPKKCCGMNVKLVDKNKLMKLVIIQLLFMFKFIIDGIQYTILEIIVKITPIDKT